MYNMFESICSDLLLKCIASAGYVSLAFVFDAQHQAAITAVVTLVIFDFITGFAAAKYTKEEIKSSRVLRTPIKLAVYFMIISAGFLSERAVGFNLLLDETILAFLAVTELISILENSGRMGMAIPQKMLNKLEAFRDSK